jgi:hypothetical protein
LKLYESQDVLNYFFIGATDLTTSKWMPFPAHSPYRADHSLLLPCVSIYFTRKNVKKIPRQIAKKECHARKIPMNFKQGIHIFVDFLRGLCKSRSAEEEPWKIQAKKWIF